MFVEGNFSLRLLRHIQDDLIHLSVFVSGRETKKRYYRNFNYLLRYFFVQYVKFEREYCDARTVVHHKLIKLGGLTD